jgi:hypothetical protein
MHWIEVNAVLSIQVTSETFYDFLDYSWEHIYALVHHNSCLNVSIQTNKSTIPRGIQITPTSMFRQGLSTIMYSHGVRLSPLDTAATVWPIVPTPDDRWWLWSNQWNANWQGKPCPSATLSTTNPTWPDPDSNPGCRGGKPATNRLSYGTAHQLYKTTGTANKVRRHY